MKTYRGVKYAKTDKGLECIFELDNILIKVPLEEDVHELIDKILDNSFKFVKEKK